MVRVAVISPIGCVLADGVVNLVEQRLHVQGVAGILVRHDVSNDLAAVGIQRQVQFPPLATGLAAMFLFQPLAGAEDFQAGAVDEDVNWTIRQRLTIATLGGRTPGSRPTAECCGIKEQVPQNPRTLMLSRERHPWGLAVYRSSSKYVSSIREYALSGAAITVLLDQDQSSVAFVGLSPHDFLRYCQNMEDRLAKFLVGIMYQEPGP